MFGAAGTLLNVSTRGQNQGKVCMHMFLVGMYLNFVYFFQPARYNIDNWDDMMMRRDERLTGHKRGQTVRLRSHSLGAHFNIDFVGQP